MKGTIRFISSLLRRRQVPGESLPHKPLSSFASSSQDVIVNEHRASNDYKPAQILNNPTHAETTSLVDGLLSHTRKLMDSPRTKDQESRLQHVVAFSGGVDSSLVLALLEASKIEDIESVHAVIGVSPAVPQDQLGLARQVADHIGTPLVEVATTEGRDETYIANEGQACLACKTHLYSALQAVADHAALVDNQPHKHHLLIYNGTNSDDVQDSTRVGLIAARNFNVQSPLVHTTKENVRRAAKHLGLPNWNIAASPCLRSRLALGVQATQDHLQRIEAAESFVRRKLHGVLSETTNLRVRLLAGNRAMLEIDADILPVVEEQLSLWQSHFVDNLNFSSVSARAFRSGSVAAISANKTKTTKSQKKGKAAVQDVF